MHSYVDIFFDLCSELFTSTLIISIVHLFNKYAAFTLIMLRIYSEKYSKRLKPEISVTDRAQLHVFTLFINKKNKVSLYLLAHRVLYQSDAFLCILVNITGYLPESILIVLNNPKGDKDSKRRL